MTTDPGGTNLGGGHNIIGGAQGNTGTVIIGKNPIIDNPLDPWWDIQGAVNSASGTVDSAKKAADTVGSVVGSVPGAVNDVSSAASSTASFMSHLGNLQLWKGIGLVIAGVMILLFAAMQFSKIAGAPNVMPIPV